MRSVDVEIAEVEVPGGRAFTVAGKMEWLPVGMDGDGCPQKTVESIEIESLTELYEGDRAPRYVPQEEAAPIIAEHRALFEEEIRDEVEARAMAAAEAREEDRRIGGLR